MVRLLGKKLGDRMQRCVWKALSTMSKPAWSISELPTLRYLKSYLDSTQLDRLPSSLSLYAQQGWHRKIGNSVATLVDGLTPERSRRIGDAARRRMLDAHTYVHRAAEVESLLLTGTPAGKVPA